MNIIDCNQRYHERIKLKKQETKKSKKKNQKFIVKIHPFLIIGNYIATYGFITKFSKLQIK